MASDEYHLVLKRQGRSQLSVNAAMCDGTEVRNLPPELDGGVLTLEVSRGGEVTNATIPHFKLGQKVEYSSKTPYWPDEITITAHLRKQAEISGELTLTPQVPSPVGFLIALVGAAAATIVRVGFKGQRSAIAIIYAVIGIGLAAAVAFIGVEWDIIWKIFGFEKPPLGSQAYLFLGIALGAFDPQRLLRKITRQEEKEESLTARGVLTEITTHLSAENVRKPFRDELHAMLFDHKYVVDHPEIIGRLDVALAAAKARASLPKELNEHLASRLERVYLGSYRTDFLVNIVARVDVAAGAIEWNRKVHYKYVRNAVDTSTDPEVVVYWIVHVAEPMRKAGIETLGQVFKSIQLSIRDARGGPAICYEGSSGKQLRGVTESVGAPPIEVEFSHDADVDELKAGFTFSFPGEFRQMPAVIVEIEADYVSELEDGVLFAQVTQPTYGYHVTAQFTPKVKYDIVEFEWKQKGRETTRIDQKKGAADLDGWLMPGNGVCVGWTGTKTAVTPVVAKRQSPSLKQRVLEFLRLK